MWWGLLGKFHPIEVWILPKNWICKNDVFSSPSFHNKSILHIHWMTAVDNTVYKTAWPFPNHCTHTWNRHKNTTLDRITGLLLSSHQHTMTQPASKNRLLTKIEMINSFFFFFFKLLIPQKLEFFCFLHWILSVNETRSMWLWWVCLHTQWHFECVHCLNDSKGPQQCACVTWNYYISPAHLT